MMEWTRQKLAHYFRVSPRVIVELEGITEESFKQALSSEAMRRLERLEGIVYNEYETDSEKIQTIRRDILGET